MTRRAYWHIRITIMALRWILRPNLGDRVMWRGHEWTLSQGLHDPIWTLRRDGQASEVHRDEFKKVRTFANYYGSFRSGYRFYRNYWLGIWVRQGWRVPNALRPYEGRRRREASK